ncbi:MAG TPA: gliding motility protein GldN [Prolixibacteraceae bacterium]|nr:gliding motility protein GldN [Prolixibacteraceae bacterium]
MKTIARISLLVLLPLWGFSQQEGVRFSESVRFTEKFGPFNNTYKQENDFTNRRLVHYPFVREADVMWSKVTWEIIDLREKVNLPLYYPTDTIDQRKSLINAIMDGIENNWFTAFRRPLKNNAFEFDQNNVMTNVSEIREIGMREEIVEVEIRPGVTRDSLVTIRWRPDEIKQIMIKEVWYIDRKDSRLRNEIIGICPIREYVVNNIPRSQPLFWIYYPDARKYFSTIPVYSMQNDKPLYSYDDLFVYRYFNSYFIQEENVYNNRMITDYVSNREAQLESERIRKDIFDYEQDLWEN